MLVNNENQLKDLIKAAANNEIEHLHIFSHPGSGKLNLLQEVAETLDKNFIILSAVSQCTEISKVLKNASSNDVVVIDELNNIPRFATEELYLQILNVKREYPIIFLSNGDPSLDTVIKTRLAHVRFERTAAV